MNDKTQLTADPDGKWIYRVGGIAAFLLVIVWFLAFPFYAAAGGPEPFGAEARLIHYAGRETAWWGILWLMVISDLFYVVIQLALYQSLKKIAQSMILLAVACKGLFVVLDLGVLWPNHAALFDLSSLYAAAASEAQRTAIINAAYASSAVLDSLLPNLYSIVIPSLGALFASLAMFKGVFSKRTAYLGLAVAATGIIAMADPFLGAWGIVHIINAFLATIWYLIVGWRFYKLGQQTHNPIHQAAFASD
ncbi:MAG TPA: hypothetical protein VIS72_03665 [Anaerolineales bacterium]